MHNAAFPLSEVARVFAQQCRQNAIRERAHAQVTQGRCSETLSECSRVGAVFRMAIEELAPARRKKRRKPAGKTQLFMDREHQLVFCIERRDLFSGLEDV